MSHLAFDPLAKMHRAVAKFTPGQRVTLSLSDPRFPLKLKAALEMITPNTLKLTLPEEYGNYLELSPGQALEITHSVASKMYFMEGYLAAIEPGTPVRLAVRHLNWLLEVQRRLFFRFKIAGGFYFYAGENRVGIDKQVLYKAGLENICLNGIGFRSRLLMPPKILIRSENLLARLLPEDFRQHVELEILWCAGGKWLGYHYGARFRFFSPEVQNAFEWLMHHMKTQRLALEYRRALARVKE